MFQCALLASPAIGTRRGGRSARSAMALQGGRGRGGLVTELCLSYQYAYMCLCAYAPLITKKVKLFDLMKLIQKTDAPVICTRSARAEHACAACAPRDEAAGAAHLTI